MYKYKLLLQEDIFIYFVQMCCVGYTRNRSCLYKNINFLCINKSPRVQMALFCSPVPALVSLFKTSLLLFQGTYVPSVAKPVSKHGKTEGKMDRQWKSDPFKFQPVKILKPFFSVCRAIAPLIAKF